MRRRLKDFAFTLGGAITTVIALEIAKQVWQRLLRERILQEAESHLAKLDSDGELGELMTRLSSNLSEIKIDPNDPMSGALELIQSLQEGPLGLPPQGGDATSPESASPTAPEGAPALS